MKLAYWEWEHNDYYFGFALNKEEFNKLTYNYHHLRDWWSWSRGEFPLLLTQTSFLDHHAREIPGGHYLVYTTDIKKLKKLDADFFKIPFKFINWPESKTINFAVNTMGFKLQP